MKNKSLKQRILDISYKYKLSHSLINWTEWYCPIKHCETIIYNTKMGLKDEISNHLREHGYAEIPKI